MKYTSGKSYLVLETPHVFCVNERLADSALTATGRTLNRPFYAPIAFCVRKETAEMIASLLNEAEKPLA